MTIIRNILVCNTWNIISLIILCAVLILSSCTCNNKDSDNSNDSDTIVKLNKILSKNKDRKDSIATNNILFFKFISAKSIRGNTKALMYTPQKNKINWQNFIVDSLKPKTINNPNGLDIKTMKFGDFGWHIYTSRCANRAILLDTFDYYAITGDKLVSLKIDSLEVEINYYDDKDTVDYYGRFIGYSDTELETISFIIQTNQKQLLKQVKFYKLNNENISISKNINKNESYDIKLNWSNNFYIGNTNESRLILNETVIIQIEEKEIYLIASWSDDGAGPQCEYYYKLFIIENGALKLILDNNYNCDI